MSETAPAAETPAATKDGLTFWPIPNFSDADMAFGADAKAYFNRRSLPKVPYELERLVNALFFNGGSLPEMAPEVDRQAAMRAVRAWLTSFAPAHEAKIATVAYALWVWTTPAALAPQVPAGGVS